MIKGLDHINKCFIHPRHRYVGLWAGLKKKKVAEGDASNDYFLAGKSLRWPMIGWHYSPPTFPVFIW
jgi:hypothetical protein